VLYPQIVPFSPPILVPLLPEILMLLKLPDPIIEDLGEAGVLSALGDAPGLPKGLECLELVYMAVEMQEPKGALAAMSVGLADTNCHRQVAATLDLVDLQVIS
jgi:hypothetical protein